ncbi:flagellar hook-associated protein FlgK [Rubinisphaera margarita]|uniref:flagellar hook-associated protein FlgK n=1 Tax=Rubinisphaera margarita TaxID=2909586 RepID=UPI001EE930FF|nr:flagellar hook-associated protein FlgK [Rubinisphaera margarita]MCG6156867.1 flagellar hook-associated protein FlgK [Rubinisphaera margarita]
MGLNASLYTAGRSLEMYSAGIQVAGQNVANANTPGYVREDLQVGTAAPYKQNGLLFGTGATIHGIRQQLDYHLEQQIHAANADSSGAAARVDGYAHLQLILGELSSGDLSSQLNAFTAAMQEVINQPELLANRQFVLQQGEQMAKSLNSMRTQLDRARDSVTVSINGLVEEANSLIDEIATLNTRIVRAESGGLLGSDAGGLRSQRLSALNRLSEIVPIRTNEQPNGMIDIFSGTEFLIINGNTQHLESRVIPDRGVPVNHLVFSKTQAVFETSVGELGASMEVRDNVLGGFADDLDLYTQAIIQEVNRIHASGEGLEGYQSVTGTYRMEDTSVALNQAGLAATPQHGSFEVKIYDKNTGTTQTTLVEIDLDGLNGDDMSLDDLRASLNGIANLSASVDVRGRLSLTADSGYEIRFSNDTSGTLAALGINTFFQGDDSNNIAVNQTLKANPNLFAAGQGDGPGDNSNAKLMAKFIDSPLELLGGASLDQFYEGVTTRIASGAAAETALHEGYTSFQDTLAGLRLQRSGVSLDEEAIKIMEYQQGYAAAARIISTIDELYSVLLNI